MSPQHLAELITLAALWGASFLFMRVGVPEFGAVAFIGVRVLIAALLLSLFLSWRGQFGALLIKWRLLLLLGLINSAVPFVLFAWSSKSLTSGVLSILNGTAPIFGAIVAWVWLREKLSVWRVVGITIAFLGVIGLVFAQNKVDLSNAEIWSIAACLLAGLLYGISSNYTKKYLHATDPYVNATGTMISASFWLLPLTLWFWPVAPITNIAWGSVVVISVFSTAIAYLMFFRLIASIGPTRAITVTFIIPLFGCLFGALILGEQITLGMVGAGLVVLFGTAMAVGLFAPKPRQL